MTRVALIITLAVCTLLYLAVSYAWDAAVWCWTVGEFPGTHDRCLPEPQR